MRVLRIPPLMKDEQNEEREEEEEKSPLQGE
jgi:hypothetical protein